MSIHDHTPGGDLVFPDEIEGTVFRLNNVDRYEFDEGELTEECSAEELPAPIDGEPRFGNWVFVTLEDDKQRLLNAPGELLQELQRLEAQPGDVFEPTRCQKAGDHESDPYEVRLEELEDDQQRL